MLYGYNRYQMTPTIIVKVGGRDLYLSPFRGYRFQISETLDGQGFISESLTCTKLHQLATIECGHAILKRLALDCIERANAERVEDGVLDEFITATERWLLKNAAQIDADNDVYQAYDTSNHRCTDLT